MSFIESILLGITQALTEFLPVSSSAHLKILKHFLGSNAETSNVLLDLSCHLGTLAALLIFLRRDIVNLLFKEPQKLKLFFLAMIPLIPSYFLLKPLREWASGIHILGLCLIGTGLILLAGQFLSMTRFSNRKPSGEIRDVLIIGAMQSAALIPGISRSASTISCARILGWTPKEAVRFSFLLSIPTILAGNAWEFLKAALHTESSILISMPSLVAAFGSAFLIGLLCVRKAINWLEQGNLKPCAWYCLALGTLTLLYFNL